MREWDTKWRKTECEKISSENEKKTRKEWEGLTKQEKTSKHKCTWPPIKNNKRTRLSQAKRKLYGTQRKTANNEPNCILNCYKNK